MAKFLPSLIPCGGPPRPFEPVPLPSSAGHANCACMHCVPSVVPLYYCSTERETWPACTIRSMIPPSTDECLLPRTRALLAPRAAASACSLGVVWQPTSSSLCDGGHHSPVARDLKVSVARLLKKCREFGILRWPYRHVSQKNACSPHASKNYHYHFYVLALLTCGVYAEYRRTLPCPGGEIRGWEGERREDTSPAERTGGKRIRKSPLLLLLLR